MWFVFITKNIKMNGQQNKKLHRFNSHGQVVLKLSKMDL
jgi:hypothetical protein